MFCQLVKMLISLLNLLDIIHFVGKFQSSLFLFVCVSVSLINKNNTASVNARGENDEGKSRSQRMKVI